MRRYAAVDREMKYEGMKRMTREEKLALVRNGELL